MKTETRGRKPLPAKDLRTAEVKVRLNPAEKKKLEKAAGDVSLAVWMREAAIEKAS